MKSQAAEAANRDAEQKLTSPAEAFAKMAPSVLALPDTAFGKEIFDTTDVTEEPLQRATAIPAMMRVPGMLPLTMDSAPPLAIADAAADAVAPPPPPYEVALFGPHGAHAERGDGTQIEQSGAGLSPYLLFLNKRRREAALEKRPAKLTTGEQRDIER